MHNSKKWLIKYRKKGNPKLYEITMEGTADAALCNINLLHCRNKLEGCPYNDILKIESINQKEDT